MSIVRPTKTPAEIAQDRIISINDQLLDVMQGLLTDGYNAF